MTRTTPTTVLACVVPIGFQIAATTFLLGFLLANVSDQRIRHVWAVHIHRD